MEDTAVEQAIDEALGGETRAADLRAMVAVLESRREDFVTERRAAADEAVRAKWQARIREIDSQLQTLYGDLAISQFVEATTRASIMGQRLESGEEPGDY